MMINNTKGGFNHFFLLRGSPEYQLKKKTKEKKGPSFGWK
jgi:hypothetical protein